MRSQTVKRRTSCTKPCTTNGPRKVFLRPRELFQLQKMLHKLDLEQEIVVLEFLQYCNKISTSKWNTLLWPAANLGWIDNLAHRAFCVVQAWPTPLPVCSAFKNVTADKCGPSCTRLKRPRSSAFHPAADKPPCAIKVQINFQPKHARAEIKLATSRSMWQFHVAGTPKNSLGVIWFAHAWRSESVASQRRVAKLLKHRDFGENLLARAALRDLSLATYGFLSLALYFTRHFTRWSMLPLSKWLMQLSLISRLHVRISLKSSSGFTASSRWRTCASKWKIKTDLVSTVTSRLATSAPTCSTKIFQQRVCSKIARNMQKNCTSDKKLVFGRFGQRRIALNPGLVRASVSYRWKSADANIWPVLSSSGWFDGTRSVVPNRGGTSTKGASIHRQGVQGLTRSTQWRSQPKNLGRSKCLISDE